MSYITKNCNSFLIFAQMPNLNNRPFEKQTNNKTILSGGDILAQKQKIYFDGFLPYGLNIGNSCHVGSYGGVCWS